MIYISQCVERRKYGYDKKITDLYEEAGENRKEFSQGIPAEISSILRFDMENEK
ncbi:MAG: hypothetical protein K2J95_05155 [Lachnospiraceae bacterium]|nr:hypothetical protein [Lachnospiraceae bacterium]